MKQVWTRFAEAKDDPEFTQWVHDTPLNLFDPGVMTYPTTKTLVAYNGETLVYMPYQKALMMESLAPKPGIEPIDEAFALRELTKAVALLASAEGIREVYFLCKDERVVRFAEHHGFKECGAWEDTPVGRKFVPWKTMRLKVGA